MDFEETLESLEEENKKSKERFYNALKSVDSFECLGDWGLSRGISAKCGDLVKIRPCGKEYKNKTYLGIYLGDAPLGAYLTVEDKILKAYPHKNPAIFVPEIKEVIYGCGSWWSRIDSLEDLDDITDDDINNVWYVKLLKEQFDKRDQ